MHGFFSVITRAFKKFFDNLHPVMNWLITFVFVNFTWVIFRANSIKDALILINRIINFNFGAISNSIVDCFNTTELYFFFSKTNVLKLYPRLLMLLFFVFVMVIVLGSKNAYEKMKKFKPSFLNATGIVLLLMWCIMSLAGVSTFLYFNF